MTRLERSRREDLGLGAAAVAGGLGGCSLIDGPSPGGTVDLRGAVYFPSRVYNTQAQSITPMRKHTVDAWLRLRYPDRDLEVVIDHTMPLPREPHTIAVDRTGGEGDAVRVRVSASPTEPPPGADARDDRFPRAPRPGLLSPPGVR